MLNFLTFLLFLIELVLKFTCHAVITILCLFEVKSDLMNVGKGVEVFVLMKELIRALLTDIICWIHQDNLSLAFFILLFKLFVFTSFVLDGIDEFSLHLRLTWEIANTFILLVIEFILLEVFVILLIWSHVTLGFSSTRTDRVRFAELLGPWSGLWIYRLWACCIGPTPWSSRIILIIFFITTFSSSFFLLLSSKQESFSLFRLFLFTGSLLSKLDQSFLFCTGSSLFSFTFKSFLILLIFNDCTWIWNILHGQSHDTFKLIGFNFFCWISCSSIFDFINLSTTNIDFKNFLFWAVEDFFRWWVKVDNELMSCWINVDSWWSN